MSSCRSSCIMGHRAAAALLHRQPRLGPVERLDLRLLIDRQHHGVLGRIDIEADDILNLGGKLRIVRQLEGLHPVGFQGEFQRDCGPATCSEIIS